MLYATKKNLYLTDKSYTFGSLVVEYFWMYENALYVQRIILFLLVHQWNAKIEAYVK